MFKKTITYVNFEDEEVTEDFWFHLSKVELAEMALDESNADDLGSRLKAIAASGDAKQIIVAMREIVLQAYGVRTDDNASFVKSKSATAAFANSPAFDELLFELLTNADAAVEFVKKCVPSSLHSQLELKLQRQGTLITPEATTMTIVAKDPRNMTRDELVAAMQKKMAGNS